MTVTFVKIPVQGAPSLLTVEDGQSTLDVLQEAVGGYIEAVGVNDGYTIYLNEEGKLDGLPLNEQATRLTRGILSPFDLVAGDVVLAGPLDDEGYDTSVDLAEAAKTFPGLDLAGVAA